MEKNAIVNKLKNNLIIKNQVDRIKHPQKS